MINKKKSDLIPSQTASYLGMTIDTGAAKIFPALAQVEKFLCGGEIPFFDRSPCSALAGAFGAPGFAGEAGPSRSSLNALPPPCSGI